MKKTYIKLYIIYPIIMVLGLLISSYKNLNSKSLLMDFMVYYLLLLVITLILSLKDMKLIIQSKLFKMKSFNLLLSIIGLIISAILLYVSGSTQDIYFWCSIGIFLPITTIIADMNGFRGLKRIDTLKS